MSPGRLGRSGEKPWQHLPLIYSLPDDFITNSYRKFESHQEAPPQGGNHQQSQPGISTIEEEWKEVEIKENSN